MENIDLVLLGVTAFIVLMLGLQHARLSEIWRLLRSNRELERTARMQKQENRELRSALRAEREHVAQLQRQVHLLLGLAPL